MKNESTTLYFKQGSSDKEYHVMLRLHEDDWWDVIYSYGRRGGPLKRCLKTKEALPYAEAKALYESMLHAKRLKGYTDGENAVVFTDNPNAGRVTGFVPQLLNEVTVEEADILFNHCLMVNEPFAVQIKHDGERRGVSCGTEIISSNRKGTQVALNDNVHQAIRDYLDSSTSIHSVDLDTEDMGDHLVIFDVLQVNDTDLRDRPFLHRGSLLPVLWAGLRLRELEDTLRIDIPFYPKSLEEFHTFVAKARNQKEEGIVIRLANATYLPGRPHSGGTCLKLKFWKSASCRIASIHPTKQSIGIEMLDETKTWVKVGNCTVNHAKKGLAVGMVVEIKYLYAYKGGSLFEPSFKGIRLDVYPKECLHSQLKYKKGE